MASNIEKQDEERHVPRQVLDRQREWGVRWRFWNGVYYVLAVSSAVLAAVAAVGWKAKMQPVRGSLFLICIGSAALTSILTLLNPKGKADAYGHALRILDSAVFKYQSDPSLGPTHLAMAVSTANDLFD